MATVVVVVMVMVMVAMAVVASVRGEGASLVSRAITSALRPHFDSFQREEDVVHMLAVDRTKPHAAERRDLQHAKARFDHGGQGWIQGPRRGRELGEEVSRRLNHWHKGLGQ